MSVEILAKQLARNAHEKIWKFVDGYIILDPSTIKQADDLQKVIEQPVDVPCPTIAQLPICRLRRRNQRRITKS